MPIRSLIIVLVAGAALAGCGRRGDLEPPGGVHATAQEGAVVGRRSEGSSPLDPGSAPPPGAGVPTALTPPPVAPAPADAPKRHFFLDFLL